MSPSAVKVALIICATIVLVCIIGCAGLIVINEQTPPPPIPTYAPYPRESK